MIKRLNRIEHLEKSLSSEFLDKPRHLRATEIMNKSLEKSKRDYILKNARSERDSENCHVFYSSFYS